MTPVDAGRELSLEDFTLFTNRHGYAVTNALQNQAHRMDEAAAEAEEIGATNYARVFRESAASARLALEAWEPLTDEGAL